MKIYTEFIVLHKNNTHPSEDHFCPFIWKSTNFDSDGDYYYEGMEEFWTHLELKCRESGKEAHFRLCTYRENTGFTSGSLEQLDLKRYIEHFRNKSYGNLLNLSQTDQLAVTTLNFSTQHVSAYREFLETVLFFLTHSKGYMVNYNLLNAEEFKEEFLK